ncbi:MAG: hypothetical protein ACO1TE_11015 [Prosthecobacter sp.]
MAAKVQGEETGFVRRAGGVLPDDEEPMPVFHLVMIDKTAHRFDAATGEVIGTTVDTKARSRGELFQQEREIETKEKKERRSMRQALSKKTMTPISRWRNSSQGRNGRLVVCGLKAQNGMLA